MYKILILDGMNLCYRYNAVMNYLCDGKGRKTGLYYGVLNFIKNLSIKYKKAKIYFVWDSPNLQKKIKNAAYKANRIKNTEEGFYERINNLKEMLSLYGINQLYSWGVEADDIAAKIIKENKNKKILLISNDNDWNLFIRSGVDIFKNNKIYTKKDIEKEIRIPINKYQYYLSITGTHNNLRGILRIKKDRVLLILNNINNMKELFNKRFEDNYCKSTDILIKKNKELIKSNFEMIKPLVDGYKIQEIKPINNMKKLMEILKDYEMKSLIEKLKVMKNKDSLDNII